MFHSLKSTLKKQKRLEVLPHVFKRKLANTLPFIIQKKLYKCVGIFFYSHTFDSKEPFKRFCFRLSTYINFVKKLFYLQRTLYVI